MKEKIFHEGVAFFPPAPPSRLSHDGFPSSFSSARPVSWRKPTELENHHLGRDNGKPVGVLPKPGDNAVGKSSCMRCSPLSFQQSSKAVQQREQKRRRSYNHFFHLPCYRILEATVQAVGRSILSPDESAMTEVCCIF